MMDDIQRRHLAIALVLSEYSHVGDDAIIDLLDKWLAEFLDTYSWLTEK